ncbi:hypothetical protein GALMADRAFT_75787 [Galerina marginata CBS 339.88]|uniref:Glycoside hydrolase 35 catalytic domain-containing protein n=1 Tax=Galerina marginata (strain CBS 339.88) TaxID=685588 RepID=A0A067SST9_GALM3|nr:hypothetical protein GALMADRAFT_75787 [Galerina marginata CBS 339.88]
MKAYPGKLWFGALLLLSVISVLARTIQASTTFSTTSPADQLNGIDSDSNPTSLPNVTPIIKPRKITPDVQWDSYSLIVRGQRVFIYSGEFHTFRLPVPSLWPDILQKVKAAGFNAISVYTHMAQINPSRGVVDFNGYRALQPLFDAAKESGLWIILRPGPYINAETSAGGISHWITTEIAGQPRSNDTDYREAWQDYIAGIIKVTAPNQISSGGPVIGKSIVL